MKRMDETHQITNYVIVENIEEMLMNIEKLGGKIIV
jgi:predicted enzyme related to lactoylglutathione lyase